MKQVLKAAHGGPIWEHRPRHPHAPKDSDHPAGAGFTDAESRIMKVGSVQHFEQAYNAQTAVEVDSRLIIAGQVVAAPNDKEELAPTLGTLDPVIESVGTVLINSGFYSEAAVKAVERSSSGALA